jgi:hypothetical protein
MIFLNLLYIFCTSYFFKYIFEFMGLTLGCTNSMIDLKLGCMYIDIQKNISISFLIYMFLWLAIKNRLNTVPLIDWLCNWDPLCNNENFSTWIYIYILYIFFFKKKKRKKEKTGLCELWLARFYS